MAKDIDVLARLVIKHDRLINLLSELGLAHSILLHEGLERCGADGCDRVATVRHRTLNVRRCDACAARLVVRASRQLGGKGAVADMVASVADAEHWLDVANAIEIRKVQDYVEIARLGIEPQPPEDASQLH